jgi:hypothetical protein
MLNRTVKHIKISNLKVRDVYKGCTDKRSFASRLIDIRGDILIFESKSGEHFFHNINEILYLEPIHNAPSEKVV